MAGTRGARHGRNHRKGGDDELDLRIDSTATIGKKYGVNSDGLASTAYTLKPDGSGGTVWVADTPVTSQEILDASTSPGAGSGSIAQFAKRSTSPTLATLMDVSQVSGPGSPAEPAVLADGLYGFACWILSSSGGVRDSESVPATLTINFGAGGFVQQIIAHTFYGNGSTDEQVSMSLTATPWYLSAGEAVQASLTNGSLRSMTLAYALYVQKIT